MEDNRYIIGIDLGTTNSVVYWIDTEEDRSPARIRHFPVPQLTAAGEVDTGAALPSFCYLPGADELPGGALRLPWCEDRSWAVGRFAREQGAVVPGRLISSAKSWLAHAGVDRTRPILPWGGVVAPAQAQSPVDVTAMFLSHLREAWNDRFGKLTDRHGTPCVLEEQQVIVTVPASFDETARELTLEATRRAGYPGVLLLEEPLAAFYAWLNRLGPEWPARLPPEEKVLIVDVGGGTTDFSIVEIDADGALHRFAVGDHLLLGGDNIDMALARRVEREWGVRLRPAEWQVLCQQCREAKEGLLAGDRRSWKITVMSRGSSVVAGARAAVLRRDALLDMLRTDFYPAVTVDSGAPKRSGGIREMGLPYATDPSVTRHLLQFLRRGAALEADGGGVAADVLYPARVLFNGGSVIPPVVREQILAVLASWFPDRPAPRELHGEDYSRAVAVGAAYYGLVRRGRGVRVRGGIARAYFIEAAHEDGAELICLMSRDTDENIAVELPRRFLLQTNEKVQFVLYTSSTRLTDRPGDRVVPADDLVRLAPLVSVLRFGRRRRRQIRVSLVSRLTEAGVLEVVAQAAETGHRWPLRFDLRTRDDGSQAAADAPDILVDTGRLEQAQRLIREAFAASPERLSKLVAALEDALDLPRDRWSVPVLREMTATLLEHENARRRTPRHEARWLNLTGFCLRPGFGDPGDVLRMQAVWKLWFAGPCHPRQPQAAAEWWVFWRRVAGGLRRGHQGAIGAQLLKSLLRKGAYRERLREGEQVKTEMWRCLGGLELLSLKSKRQAARALLERRRLSAAEYWVLARVGARHLFHAPLNDVVPASIAGPWAARLMAPDHDDGARMRLFALARLAARTGNRQLDLPPEIVAAVESFLRERPCPAAWLAHVGEVGEDTEEERAAVFGDSVPLGLRLDESASSVL